MPTPRIVHVSFQGVTRLVETTDEGDVRLDDLEHIACIVSPYELDPASIVLAGRRGRLGPDGQLCFPALPEDDDGLLGRAGHPLIMYGRPGGKAAISTTKQWMSNCMFLLKLQRRCVPPESRVLSKVETLGVLASLLN